MDFYTLSDAAILAELGSRLKALRLRRNVTQEALAEATTVSVNTIKSLETGHGKLATLVAVLRELQALDQLNQLLPEITISPLELAKRQGKVRERASGHRGETAEDESAW